MPTSKDMIYIGGPYIVGPRRCTACGRYVDRNCYIVKGKGGSFYVCNVMCGIKVCDATE